MNRFKGVIIDGVSFTFIHLGGPKKHHICTPIYVKSVKEVKQEKHTNLWCELARQCHKRKYGSDMPAITFADFFRLSKTE